MLILLAACTSGPEETDTGVPPHRPDGCEPAAGEICTVIGAGIAGNDGGTEHEPLEVWLFYPSALVVDAQDRLVLDDYNNNVLRRLDDDGVLRVIVGNGGHGYAVHGVDCLQTSLENPSDLAYAADGTLYLYEEHGARILRVDPSGWLEVIAGDPVYPGYDDWSGDGGPALGAGVSQGWGLALADDGTLYWAEDMTDVIRVMTPDGTIDTVAGLGDPYLMHANAGFVDGVGSDARFRMPWDVAVHEDALYVADTGNHAIRKIDRATREVTTIAGVGTPGMAGDGGPALEAELSGPIGLSFGPDGGLYFADSGNHAIRRIDPDGTLTTVVGQLGVSGFSGDGGPPLDARLSSPYDVLVREDGDVYVVDTFNNRIRVVPGLAAP